MKKVLLVTHVSGFVPQFEMNNVRYLQEKGYEVHYAANFDMISYGGDNSRLEDTGIICHHIPFNRSPFTLQNAGVYRKLKALIDAEAFQLIHCHTPMGGMMARMAARKARRQGTKVIYTAHGFHFFKGAPLQNWLLYYPVERFLSRFTDVQITINSEDYQRARKFHAGQVVFIPGVGINTGRLREKSVISHEQFRQSLGIQADDICILSVGELVKNKNHRIVLEALSKLQDERVKYLICGQGSETASLNSLARDLQLERQVQLLGFRKDVAKIYEIADIFVFPSLREGLSVALMEAMGKGLPVVCSRIRGNQDLIQDREGGLLVSPRDADELAGALEKLCADQELRSSMGAYNQEAVTYYDQAVVLRIMAQVYDRELEQV